MIVDCIKGRLEDESGNAEISIASGFNSSKLQNSTDQVANTLSIEVKIDDKYTAIITLLYEENKQNVQGEK